MGVIMSARQDPILTQFAVLPDTGSEGTCLEVDLSTGLLHESGVIAPYVEELIAMASSWRRDIGTGTLLTEAEDPIDPDIVRGDSPWLRASGESVLTRRVDPADPDLVRGDIRRLQAGVETVVSWIDDQVDPDLVRQDSAWSRLSAAAITIYTKADGDPIDPDLIRTVLLQRFIGCTETVITRIEPEGPDPDLLRTESGREWSSSDA
jgi:hypothetical protein